MEPFLPPLWPTAVVLALLASLVALAWVGWDGLRALHGQLTQRFLLGVPWGSVIVLGTVLLVYLFVQDGVTNFDRPVFFPFVNWSYLYPTGVIFAPFAHGNAAHLIGNLTTAALLAPLAEYVWGHYPPSGRTRWGRVAIEDRDGPLNRPVVRAFVVFPAVAFGVALLTSLFTLGPVIGFSGVVFAFAGFTVVRFPIVTLLALLARSVVREFGAALFDPVVEATTEVTLTTPGWVGIAFQGHGLGFLVGAFLGILLIHHRDARIDPVRLWFGLVVLMIATGLWAIWISRNGDVFVLYRGLGFTLVFLVTVLLVLAVTATDRSIWRWVTRRRTAILVLGLVVVAAGGIAVPFNLLAVTDYSAPGNAVEIEGYDVFYDPEVQSDLRPLVGPDDEPTNASGVIVVDEDREMWIQVVSSNQLEFSGAETIALGDIGERVEFTANRTGWSPVGNDSVYRVRVETDGTETPVYAAETQFADVTIGGYEIGIGARTADGFHLAVVDAAGDSYEAPVPQQNASVEIDELEVIREDDRLLAAIDDTRVPIAERESG